MKTRFQLHDVVPAALKPVIELDKFVHSTGIDKHLMELIKIRASQLNGCAYCLHKHTQDAVKYGEDPKRLFVLSAWREAKNWFTEEEQLVLILTEEVTLIGNHGISDEIFTQSVELFGEEKTANLIMAIICINTWNRIGVSFSMHP